MVVSGRRMGKLYVSEILGGGSFKLTTLFAKFWITHNNCNKCHYLRQMMPQHWLNSNWITTVFKWPKMISSKHQDIFGNISFRNIFSHLDWDMKRVSLRGLSSNLSKNLIFRFLQIKQMYVTSVEQEAMVGHVS